MHKEHLSKDSLTQYVPTEHDFYMVFIVFKKFQGHRILNPFYVFQELLQVLIDF